MMFKNNLLFNLYKYNSIFYIEIYLSDKLKNFSKVFSKGYFDWEKTWKKKQHEIEECKYDEKTVFFSQWYFWGLWKKLNETREQLQSQM